MKPAAALPALAERRAISRRRTIDWLPYVMVAPAVLVLTIFSLGPAVYAALVSLYNVQFVALLEFVGLANYVAMFTNPDFWQSLRVSLIFTACSSVSGRQAT